MRKVLTLICVIAMLGGGIFGFVKYKEWNDTDVNEAQETLQDKETKEEVNESSSEVKEEVNEPSSEIIVETTVEVTPEAITPTGFVGKVQNYCVFHDGGVYYPRESNYISKCPDLTTAKLLGEIKDVDNNVLPGKELAASQFDIGDKVYELDGELYVVQKTHYHKMYRSEE